MSARRDMRWLGLDPLGLVLCAVGGVALATLPLVLVKANRILPGEPRAIVDVLPATVAWGFHALTGSLPLNAPPIDDETQRVIVLLTDGLNTQNRWTSSESSIDARTQLACTNIKAANIQIYTVMVMAGDSQLLQSCASDPGKYFALTQSGQIVSTFNQIGIALTQLRIAQ